MPPRTRATKVAKVLKENNIAVENKIKSKNAGKPTKVLRKPLADKTNSASDDNASIIEVTKASLKKTTKNAESNPQTENHVRIRRERRAPSRFIENYVVKTISINQESSMNTKKKYQNYVVLDTLQKTKKKSDTKSPSKYPQQDKESSIVANRPKRVHRLPSRFEDHLISPSKFIPVQPCFASTPIAKQKPPINAPISKQVASEPIAPPETTTNKKVVRSTPVKKFFKTTTIQKISKNTGIKKGTRTSPVKKSKSTVKIEGPRILESNSASDTNNNPKHEQFIGIKNNENYTSPGKNTSPQIVRNKRLINTSFSFRVLEEKKSSPKRAEEKLAVYDFTYDPSEEPPPQKKKRKRTVKKKVPPKPKVVIVKNNYDTNISKTLMNLKQAVKQINNPMKVQPSSSSQNPEQPMQTLNKQPVVAPATTTSNKVTASNVQNIEDEPVDAMELNDHMDYSPVPSPNHIPRQQVKTPAVNETRDQLYTRARSTMRPDNIQKDPLNLIGDLSFFDEEPVASSSLNNSVRDPLATPWRVEYTNLPIKWPVNAHVKANMTPAVESSFISTHENKKHVYTNMVLQSNDSLPDIVTNDTGNTNLKQTSIIDCIREIALRSANKKKSKITPTKTDQSGQHTTKKQPTPNKSNNSSHNDNAMSHNVTPDPTSSNTHKNLTSEQENSVENRTSSKRKSNALKEITPAKIACVKEPNVDNCFGFDDSENQENVSPRKKDCIRSLRPRSRAVLKEFNAITGPLRAKLPLAAKTKFAASSDVVNKLFDEMKSATGAPELPENDEEKEAELSSVRDPSWHESMEANDEESVHLFEDIDLFHNLKSQRRSYGKAKKVTFCQKSTINTETQLGASGSDDEGGDSDEDDPDDLPFKMPTTKTKRVTKKKKKGSKFSKKEEVEVEAWAAAFNSMCEDVEEFKLVLE